MSKAKTYKELNPYMGTFHINNEGRNPEEVRKAVQRKLIQYVIRLHAMGLLKHPENNAVAQRPLHE